MAILINPVINQKSKFFCLNEEMKNHIKLKRGSP